MAEDTYTVVGVQEEKWGAAVRIMNMILVSVTERVREIGIRLAIGALEREVLTRFLVEAVVLSSFYGLVGIVLALAGSFMNDSLPAFLRQLSGARIAPSDLANMNL